MMNDMTGFSNGWSYLGGRRWWEITRDERTFCQHLYGLVQKAGVPWFVGQLNTLAALENEKKLPVDSDWEIGFEVCFYRDVWFSRGKEGQCHSGKRTFDLCLFSNKHIVIIEAKAQQGFDSDPSQLKDFERDRIEVKKLVPEAQVHIIALASSKYVFVGDDRRPLPVGKEEQAIFDGQAITWKQLAEQCFDGDLMLLRADDIYEFASKNNDGLRTGRKIFELAKQGQRFCVGRQDGLKGKAFQDDLVNNKWEDQIYQVKWSEKPPNSNWFSAEDFMSAVSKSSESFWNIQIG